MNRKQRLVARALLLAGLGAALLLSSAAAATAPRVRIVQPGAGAVVEGATVPIVLAVDGTDLPAATGRWPGPGSFHLALDGTDVVQTSELHFTLMGIPPGAHRLQATLEDSGATALPSEVVAFTARSSPPAAGASWYLAGTVALVAGVMFGALLLLWFFWVRPQHADDPGPGAKN